jgi:hypothetical protein
MAIATQTTIPDSFGKGGANIGDGTPVLSTVLQEHKTALGVLDTAQSAALQAAIDASAAAVAVAAANTGIVKRTITVTQADDLAAVDDTTLTKNLGAILPTNARLVGCEISVGTLISGGAINAVTASIGVTGTAAAIGQATSVFTGATGFPKALTAGASGYMMHSLSGLQATVTVTSTGANLSAATAGSITANLYYIVLP